MFLFRQHWHFCCFRWFIFYNVWYWLVVLPSKVLWTIQLLFSDSQNNYTQIKKLLAQYVLIVLNVCNLLVQCFVYILSIPCEFFVNKLFSVVIWMNEFCMVCTQVKSYDFLTLHDADLIVPSDYDNALQSMIVHTFQQIWFTILFTRLHICQIMENYAFFCCLLLQVCIVLNDLCAVNMSDILSQSNHSYIR